MSKWLKTLVSHTDTLEAAINAISESELFVALVVDDKNRLLGTITDGDMRRALLKHISMDAVVTEFMNSNPVFASTEDSADRLLSIMKGEDILHLPIVDHAGRVVNLETLQNLSQSAKYDNPVFLMAGGFGTRLKHLTKDKPKPLLKVGDTPILELILKQFVDAGFHNFFISTHYKAEMIREHFGSGSNWNVNIQYVHESEPLGTAGALGMLPLKKPGPPILMMNGDLLTRVDYKNLLNFHNKHKGLATMCVREYDFQVPYGVVNIDHNRINTISEKPVHKFFVNAGIYVLERDILDGLNGESYLDLPNLFENCLDNGEQINAFPIHEYWIDIGRIEEYERANNEVHL